MIRTEKIRGTTNNTGVCTNEAATCPIIVPRLFATCFGQITYQFNDTTRREADVIVGHVLQATGTEMWPVGRVFNRGLKPAHNVRIKPNLISKYGVRTPAITLYLAPSDIPPTSFANFEGHVSLFRHRH